MKSNSMIKAILVLATFAFGMISAHAQGDTSKVCTGQGVTLTGPTATLPAVYAYAWFDASSSTPIGTSMALPIVAGTLANVSGAPVQHIYKLVVTQTGDPVLRIPFTNPSLCIPILVIPLLLTSLSTVPVLPLI